jgi:hypothetical protein
MRWDEPAGNALVNEFRRRRKEKIKIKYGRYVLFPLPNLRSTSL